jgi:Arc-like DNA binding domain
MVTNNEQERSRILSAQFPQELREQIVQSARANDRSVSAELRKAVREYVAKDDRPLLRLPARDETSEARQSSSSQAGLEESA